MYRLSRWYKQRILLVAIGICVLVISSLCISQMIEGPPVNRGSVLSRNIRGKSKSLTATASGIHVSTADLFATINYTSYLDDVKLHVNVNTGDGPSEANHEQSSNNRVGEFLL